MRVVVVYLGGWPICTYPRSWNPHMDRNIGDMVASSYSETEAEGIAWFHG